MMYANVCLCQCSRICNDTNASFSNYKGKAQLHAGYEIMQGNITMKDKSYEHEERWMLHGNISQKGYGNALIGRYGGCFEEGYKEVYDDRAYHAKGLDTPRKFAPTLEVRKGNARYRRG